MPSMYHRIKVVLLSIAALLMAPQLALFALSSARDVILKDVRRWAELLGYPRLPGVWMLLFLLAAHQEFRNVYYYRISAGNLLPRLLVHVFKLFCSELPTLSISARHSIGPGLFIQHGFCTVIAADRIGENCFVSQQVTIGYKTRTDCPQLGNRVAVTAGAKVLGAVRVGDHVVVGANAVVVKDVPDNCVVVGIPARIVRRDGVRVDEALT